MNNKQWQHTRRDKEQSNCTHLIQIERSIRSIVSVSVSVKLRNTGSQFWTLMMNCNRAYY